MSQYDIVVVGGGPGGYVAAIRAAQLGFSVCCVDKSPRLGGTCLNVGCIPSKTLLHIAKKYQELSKLSKLGLNLPQGETKVDVAKIQQNRNAVIAENAQGIAYLFKKNKVTHVQGSAKLGSVSGDVKTVLVETSQGQKELQAKRIILATGSVPGSLPGFEIDEKTILSSTGALELSEIPQHLLVVGAGVIGLELGSVWAALGAKVTVLEYSETFLPTFDQSLAKAFQKHLTKQGLDIKLGSKVKSIHQQPEGELPVTVFYEDKGQETSIQADKVLMAVGRNPLTKGLGLEEANIVVTPQGFIQISKNYETSCPGVYAIGDVVEGPMLAHKAEEEGVALVEQWAGIAGEVHYNVIPSIIYTNPEFAMVGQTEAELKALSVNYKAGYFPFSANSRARASFESVGGVKILACAQSDRVLGVHILGPEASSLIQEAAIVMAFKGSSEDIARTCHAHPTYAEAMKEAALAVEGHAIHM